MPTATFRFGVTLPPTMEDRRWWVDAVRRVEANGFSVLTVADHFGNGGGVFPALISAYETAPSLRVGTLVLNNDIWNPAVLAREVITCDILTEGGFELGMGAGWHESDYTATGIERQPPGQRIARLDESVSFLRRALAGEAHRAEGDNYSLVWDGRPRPRQRPVPLLIGGGSPRILRLAGRQADIVSLHRNLERGAAAAWDTEAGIRRQDVDPIAERVGWIREGAGDRFDQLELHALLQQVVVTDRRMEAAEELGRSKGFSGRDILDSPHCLVGTVEQMAEDLRERRERWGISYWTLVGADLIDDFAPVLARLRQG